MKKERVPVATPPRHWNDFPSEYKANGEMQDLSWRQKHIYWIKASDWKMGIRKARYKKAYAEYEKAVEEECKVNLKEYGLYLSHSDLCDLSDKIEQVKKYVEDWSNFGFIYYDENDLKVLKLLLNHRPELFHEQSLNLSIFESE